MPSNERTDRAVQHFLDSLSQIPGSVLYRDRYQWKAVSPTEAGQVLALSQDLIPEWIEAPSPGGGPIEDLNPMHHHDTSKESFSDGQIITTLTDYGGAKEDLTNTSGTPTWSDADQAIIFDGVDDALQPATVRGIPVPHPYTWVLVTEIGASPNFAYYLGSATGAGSTQRPQFYHYSSVGFDPRFNAGSTVFGDSNEPFDLAIWTVIFDGQNSVLYRNDNIVGTGNSGSEQWRGFTIGNRYDLRAGHFSNLKFKECAGLGFRPTTQQIESMIQGLATKWGITL